MSAVRASPSIRRKKPLQCNQICPPGGAGRTWAGSLRASLSCKFCSLHSWPSPTGRQTWAENNNSDPDNIEHLLPPLFSLPQYRDKFFRNYLQVSLEVENKSKHPSLALLPFPPLECRFVISQILGKPLPPVTLRYRALTWSMVTCRLTHWGTLLDGEWKQICTPWPSWEAPLPQGTTMNCQMEVKTSVSDSVADVVMSSM